MSKRYTIEGDLMPIIEGKVALPNWQEKPIAAVVNDIAARGHMMTPKWGYSRRAPDAAPSWTQFFLFDDGTGYALIYGGGYPTPGPIVGRFAICEHEKKDAPDANHQRGWHPGHCKKCGLDMTVDSGD